MAQALVGFPVCVPVATVVEVVTMTAIFGVKILLMGNRSDFETPLLLCPSSQSSQKPKSLTLF
jgi:hypothetical protein